MNGLCVVLAAASLLQPVENCKFWVLPRTTAIAKDIAANESRHFEVVMVGDSITACWLKKEGPRVRKERLGAFSVLNLGVSGDNTQNVLWRFDQGELDGYTADVFQIMIGSNDGGNRSPDDMKALVGEIIRRIREKHPESKVLLLPIFYVSGGRASRPNVTRDARNAKLKELADGETVIWHDFNARFYDEADNISKAMLYDGQHPNTKAQEIWADEVRPIFARLVADAKAQRKTVTVEVKPGADLAAALREVNAKRRPGDRGEIVLEDGVYPIAKTVAFDAAASFVTVRAKNPGKAVLVGGTAFRGADFKPVADESVLKRLPAAARGKVRQLALTDELREKFEKGHHTGGGNWTYRDWNNYAANKPRGKKDFDYPDFPCLTVGQKRQELARWPNGRDWCWIGETNLVRKTKDGKNTLVATGTGREKGWNFDRQKIAAAGWINAWRYLNWCTAVTGLDAETGALTLAEAKVNPLYARAFFFNIPEELDEPGEWCYDGKSGTVLYWPQENFADDTLCAIGATTDILLHVTGDGIAFRGLAVTAKVGHPAVVVEGAAAGNEIRGCTFTGIGYDAVWVGGRYNAVRDCDFTDIVSMAIGVQGGDLKTMIPACNWADNNRVRHPEILCTTWAKSGIYVDGVGNRISHNVVSDSVSSGIYFAGYDHVLEYNRVYDVNKEFDDVGVVYSPGGGRCYGIVFRYNDLSGLPGQGVTLYYDDATSGHEAYGNVLRNGGSNNILIGGGRDNNIHDNLLVGGFTGIEMDNRGLTWPAYTKRPEAEMRATFAAKWNITNQYAAIRRKHPQLYNWYTNDVPLYSYAGNRFERNVIVDPSGYATVLVTAKGKAIDPKYTVFTNNVLVRTTGPKNGLDLVLHPETAATNEYSATIPRRLPIGPVRVVDGTPERPIDLGFVDLPETTFDPYPYFTYAPQNWVDRPKLYELRREKFASLVVKPWRKGDFTLKPGARLLKEIPDFKPIPWNDIGLYKTEWRTDTEDVRGN